MKLEIQNLSKSFVQYNQTKLVLDDLNFHVKKGEILCIVGSSGSGKSTLLRQLAGFEKPDSGRILLNGELISKPGPDRIFIFQDFNQLFPWKTVLENIIFPLQINKIGADQASRKEIALKYISLVKLDGFEDYYPHQLSGGMKQKAALARSLAIKPEILLMDEPFASLDAQTRDGLQNILLNIWKDTGVTIVFVTHDIQEAIFISDRIMILSKERSGIRAIIENEYRRPRNPGDPEFGRMWKNIYKLLDE